MDGDGRANIDSQTRGELEALVRDVQRLVELAQQEAARIVADARAETTRRVEELVIQAEELRQVAETELAEARQETDRIRREARAEADRLLAQARETHDQVVQSAQKVEGAGDRAGTDPTSAEDLQEARAKADKLLRLALAEAKARSAEMLEQARRRAESVEAEARAKIDELKREYREMQRRLREEEIAVKARIADLQYQADPRPGSAQRPTRTEAENPVEAVSVPDPAKHAEAPSGQTPAPPLNRATSEPDTVELDRSEIESGHRPVEELGPDSDAASATQRSIRIRLAEETEDPDVLKALRAFKPRH